MDFERELSSLIERANAQNGKAKTLATLAAALQEEIAGRVDSLQCQGALDFLARVFLAVIETPRKEKIEGDYISATLRAGVGSLASELEHIPSFAAAEQRYEIKLSDLYN